MTDIITDDDLREAERCEALGPAYFVARRVTERAMAAFEDKHLKPLIETAARQFQEKLWDDVQLSLWSDTEMNLQSEMWRTVDSIVLAIMGGKQWALQRYALGPKHDCEEVRAAVARHIPREIMDRRIIDLEEQVKSLTERLEWARR